MPRRPFHHRGRPHGSRHGGPPHEGDGAGRRRPGHRGDSEPAPRFQPGRYAPPPAPPRPAELEPTDRLYQGLRLYPFQARAIDAVAAGHSVLVAAPTGSGKTLVADYAIDQAFEQGWRVVYTSPIKALSNQKYRDFRARHGDQVGILTGDVTMNPDASLLVMTTEVFRNTLLDEPERLRDFRFVVHDEVHYLDDAERGTVWEESIIHAPPQMRLVCLSATVPNVQELADWMGTVRGEPVTVVEMNHRPVPLDHLVWVPDHGPMKLGDGAAMLDLPFKVRSRMRRERSPARLLDWLQVEKLLPVLFFCFSRKDCEALAKENRTRRLLPADDVARMASLFDDLARRYELDVRSPAVVLLREMALSGVGYHHAGMLPIHKEIVERLFTSGLLRMLFATETFALGVNMPARTVAFQALRKFDGERMDYMLCREYGQMAGRAGRQGIDSHGLVVSMIDPRMDRSKGVRRVLTGGAERVESRWNPEYATILSIYRHLGERVVDTYQKSFARYQRSLRRQGHDGRSGEERVLAARLSVLRDAGYVDQGKLTEKGAFASRINGYEIHAAEFRDAALLDRLEAPALGALLLAAAYEPRVDEMTTPPRDRAIAAAMEEAIEIVARWRTAEWQARLTDLTKEPHFGLTAVLEAWIAGRTLAQCAELTTAKEGDIVRWLRLMLQYARQIRKALPQHQANVKHRLDALVKAVNRDEVDARRQLELGQDPLVGEDGEDRDDERSDEERERDAGRRAEELERYAERSDADAAAERAAREAADRELGEREEREREAAARAADAADREAAAKRAAERERRDAEARASAERRRAADDGFGAGIL